MNDLMIVPSLTHRTQSLSLSKPGQPVLASRATASALVAAAVAACAAAEQPVVATSGGIFLPKPAWLTDLSVGISESYDDNLYGVSGKGPMAPQSSWITTVSPKLGINLAPLLGDGKTLQALNFGYAPDLAIYHDASVESYNAHRFANTIKGKTDSFSFNLENALSYVDGSQVAPIYSGSDSYRNSNGGALPRERRQQIQDRAKILFQYDLGQFFVRPAAELLLYDMRTDLRSTTGYQNYPSRNDVNGGADVGYRLTKDLAVTLGYRYGNQYQLQMPVAVDPTQLDSSNDYQRALVGLEGKSWKWLTFSILAGPDFRSYGATAGVSDRTPITYYGEASAAAQITAKDSLTLKYKQWRFVSYSGRLPCSNSDYDLKYRRKLTQALTLDLAGRATTSDFTCGYDPSTKHSDQREDWSFIFSPGLTYAFTPNLSANLAYSLQAGRGLQDNPPGGAQYRDFDRNLVSGGVMFKF